MPRRVSLPGANELFLPTVGSHEPQSVEVPQQSKAHRARKTSQDATSRGKHAGSGRVRHDEKITVYVSTEELIALENVFSAPTDLRIRLARTSRLSTPRESQ